MLQPAETPISKQRLEQPYKTCLPVNTARIGRLVISLGCHCRLITGWLALHLIRFWVSPRTGTDPVLILLFTQFRSLYVSRYFWMYYLLIVQFYQPK